MISYHWQAILIFKIQTKQVQQACTIYTHIKPYNYRLGLQITIRIVIKYPDIRIVWISVLALLQTQEKLLNWANMHIKSMGENPDYIKQQKYNTSSKVSRLR